MKNLVIATDGSAAAEEAVEFGLELALDHGAAVVFVHAVPAEEFAVGRLAAVPRPHGEPVDDSDAALGAAAAAAEKAGVSHTLERLSDDTVHAILQVAEREDADLIVVGSHGHRGVGSLLGSVSRDLLRRADRPVLVVKAAPASASS